MQRTQQFVRLQDVFPRRRAKLLYGDFAGALGPNYPADGVVNDQCRNGIGCWRRVAQVSTERGATLNLNSADQFRSIDEPRVGLAYTRILVNAIAGNCSSERQASKRIIRNLLQFRDVLHIDHQIEISPIFPHLHDQIRASAEDPPSGSRLLEQSNGFF